MMLLIEPCPWASSTLSEMIDAPGAMPAFSPYESCPLPPMMPATWVPWPLSSYGMVRPLTKSTNLETR
jgi:hypothetical protein